MLVFDKIVWSSEVTITLHIEGKSISINKSWVQTPPTAEYLKLLLVSRNDRLDDFPTSGDCCMAGGPYQEASFSAWSLQLQCANMASKGWSKKIWPFVGHDLRAGNTFSDVLLHAPVIEVPKLYCSCMSTL